MKKLLISSRGGANGLAQSSKRITIFSSCIALAATTIVTMITESAAATALNAFRSDSCLDLEGLKSAQQYFDGYRDAHHDFVSGLGQKNLQNQQHHHHLIQEVYKRGYLDGWSDAQRGILNSEC